MSPYGAEIPSLEIPPPECMVTASEVASAWATSKIRRESIKNGSNRKNLKLFQLQKKFLIEVRRKIYEPKKNIIRVNK